MQTYCAWQLFVLVQTVSGIVALLQRCAICPATHDTQDNSESLEEIQYNSGKLRITHADADDAAVVRQCTPFLSSVIVNFACLCVLAGVQHRHGHSTYMCRRQDPLVQAGSHTMQQMNRHLVGPDIGAGKQTSN